MIQFIFHYNPYNKQWACVHRDGYLDYMNGKASYEHVFYADSIDTLLTLFQDDLKKNDSTQDEEKK
jgi:hypothetical protein